MPQQSKNKKRYKHKSSFVVESTEQLIYNLFYDIRFHSFETQDFKNDLEDVCTNLNLTTKDLMFQGCSLLFYSAIYENSTIFKFLVENYKEEFHQDILKSIYYTYSNRDSQILKLALENLTCTHEEKIKLLTTFAQNCYKEDNIQIINDVITNWLNNNLITQDDINTFTSQLIHNNNISFLSTSSKNDFWKQQIIKQISSHTDIINQLDMTEFYHKIISNISNSKHSNQALESLSINDLDLRHFMSCDNLKLNNHNISSKDVLKKTSSQNETKDSQDTKKLSIKKNVETNQPVIQVKRRILQ